MLVVCMYVFACEMLRYYGYAAKTVSPVVSHIANYSEFELYLQDEHFETIASKIGAFLPV